MSGLAPSDGVFSKILVGIDGSDHSRRALEMATNLARIHGSEVLVLHVVDRVEQPRAIRELAHLEHIPFEDEQARYLAGQALSDAMTRAAADEMRAKGVERIRPCVAEGRPARQIIELAKQENVDLIVLGSRGLGDIGSVLLGGVSHKVAHLSECPCLLVR